MPLTSSSGDWNIRKAKADDAEALVDLFNRLGHETDFMLFEPEERNITVEEEAKRLESWEAASSGAVFIASIGREIVGFVVGDPRRDLRRAEGTSRLLLLTPYPHRCTGLPAPKAAYRESSAALDLLLCLESGGLFSREFSTICVPGCRHCRVAEPASWSWGCCTALGAKSVFTAPGRRRA
jgi:hypothetical protein